VPRNLADRLDQSDESSGPVVIDYSEKRALPITIPDCSTVHHAGERYVVIFFCVETSVTSVIGVKIRSGQCAHFSDIQLTAPSKKSATSVL
jgi:hypothetical protein